MPYVDKLPRYLETSSGVGIYIIEAEAVGQCVACSPAPKFSIRIDGVDITVQGSSAHKGRFMARRITRAIQ